jgi:tetratricopeptide (TPR) repeat protein
LDRIQRLIKKGHIRGDEPVREHPDGDWKPFAHYSELAEVLLALASGKPVEWPSTRDESGSFSKSFAEGAEKTQILEPTQVLSPEPVSGPKIKSEPVPPAPEVAPPRLEFLQKSSESRPSDSWKEPEDPSEQTMVAPLFETDEERTTIGVALVGRDLPHQLDLGAEQTVVFQRSNPSEAAPGKPVQPKRPPLRRVIVLLGLVLVAVELLSDLSTEKKKPAERIEEVRPRLPSTPEKGGNPIQSQKYYAAGLTHYRDDSLPGYRLAAAEFMKAAELDADNVRALAMLASSYLNLIDVSNKDETYFSVISKLIELSRAKDLDLTETLIAEVEYLLFSQRPAAAQTRIIDFTKTHKNYDSILFAYLSQVLVARGDYATAARYLSALSDDKPFSVKVFYLRGQVAEGLGDLDAALMQYSKAVAANPRHGASRLRILKILESRATLKEGKPHLVYLSKNPLLLPPREQAQALSWRATIEEADGKLDVALGLVERALRLDSENPAYSLQHYLLRARVGDSVPAIRKEARLYYYLAEGERLAREGKVEDALFQFLEARRENPNSPLPLIKRGELFYQIKKDIVNARLAYQKAAELAPRDVRVWSKYIELLIQSYEWDEAAKAMARFRVLPVPQGIVDKISADWYARQGLHADAQANYRKAMSRSFIDPSVYLAYGKSLVATKNYDQAPFIFSLAMRLDPDNAEAILGTAAAIAGAEGIDRSIAYLQDELQKGRGTRIEILCGIASYLIQKGKLDQAVELIEQAKILRPDAGLPWKTEAELNLARGPDKKWKEKAERAYAAYLDRNASDAVVMYERYRMLVETEQYEKADQQLGVIYESYPKFPSLHFSKGLIYVRLSNFKAAIREFEQELKNGNHSLQNLVELGKAHLELKESEKALEYFVRAMKSHPMDSEAKFQAGKANFALNRYDAAIAMYQEAIKIDAGNPLIYRHLGYAYRATGDGVNMRWAFSKYLEMEPDAADKAEIQKNL